MDANQVKARVAIGRELLAAVYRRPESRFQIRGLIASEMFSDPAQRKVWEAVEDASSAGEGINLASLMARGVDLDLLMALDTGSAAGEAETVTLARRLAEHWMAAAQEQQLGVLAHHAAEEDPARTVEALDALLAKWKGIFAAGHHTTLATHMDRYLESIAIASRGERRLIRTGIPALDAALGGGFTTTDLVIIGGTPGTGKTALVLNMVHEQIENGVHVGFLEAEMSRDEIFSVLNAIHDGVPADDIRSGRVDVLPFLGWLHSKHCLDFLEVNDSQKNPRALENMVELLARKGCEVIYLDYLQCWRVRGNGRVSEYESVSHLASVLRSLSLRLGVCIVAIASNNRDAADHTGRPTLQSYRGSGEAEYNATRAIQLHRVSKDPEEFMGDRKLDLLLLKNRAGRTGVISLNFNLPAQRIRDASRMADDPLSGKARAYRDDSDASDDEKSF
jgi:replicative DNA helicase